MKKTWVALAVIGAFAGAAQAQSSVTVYGILDVNYMWEEGPTNVGGVVQQESKSAINSGHQSGSRWGLRGSEDLGGGLSAIFTLEGGYGVDDGQLGQGGRLFGRQAWAGLRGGWGTVAAGRIATFSSGTGSFYMTGDIDPFATGFGLASLGNTFYSMNATRLDNSIMYQTPNWAGFMGGVGYSTRISGQETAPSDTNSDALFTGLNWKGGPFFVAVTYDVFNGVANQDDQKHLQVGGTFDIGPFRLHAGWADQSNVRAVPTANQGGSGSFITLPAGIPAYDTNAYMLGATWTIGAFKVFGSWQQQDADAQTVTVAGSPINFDPDFSIYSIGATYNLSRRTNFYTSYASRDADGTLAGNQFDAKQFALGIRHLF